MRYYNKAVYPKEATTDPDFKDWVKERIAHHLVDAIMDNMTFDEQDDCINHPELQDKNGWVTEYIGSVDISIPTKLIPMGSVYVCEMCFFNNEVPTSYHFSDKVPKYCFNCGGHFTNIYRENGYYLIKEKEVNNDKTSGLIDNAPTIPLPDFKEGYKQAIVDGKTNFSRGECKSCRHRDPEDKKCDCGALERQGCYFPVSDDYYCKYYEEVKHD